MGVLCGVLDLALIPVLIGTSPEIIKILPNCMSMGFLLKSREPADMQNTFKTLYFAAFVVALVIPGSLTLGVAVLVKREIDAHKDVFEDPNSNWFRDPQEAEILAAIEQDHKEAERLERLTSWNVQPTWVRLVMVAGAVSASLSLYMQGGKPFESFEFQDPRGLGQIPGGAVVNLIRPSGFAIIGLAGVTTLFLAIFKLWSALQSSKQLEMTGTPVMPEPEHETSPQTCAEITQMFRVSTPPEILQSIDNRLVEDDLEDDVCIWIGHPSVGCQCSECKHTIMELQCMGHTMNGSPKGFSACCWQ